MNKLKKILLKELTPLIPFGFASDRINECWNVKGKYEDATFFEKVNGIRRWGLNILTSGAISLMAVAYSMASLSSGTLDCTKWAEASKQKEMRMEREARAYSKKQFYEADKNKDLVIDSNEFYDYIQGQRGYRK